MLNCVKNHTLLKFQIKNKYLITWKYRLANKLCAHGKRVCTFACVPKGRPRHFSEIYSHLLSKYINNDVKHFSLAAPRRIRKWWAFLQNPFTILFSTYYICANENVKTVMNSIETEISALIAMPIFMADYMTFYCRGHGVDTDLYSCYATILSRNEFLMKSKCLVNLGEIKVKFRN